MVARADSPPRTRLTTGGRATARDLAIDLGTANTLVYARGRGIVLDEPSVIALDSTTGDVLAIGHDAREMIGRTPDHIQAVRPLRQGAITDFDITQRMIRLLLARAGVTRYSRSRLLICVPSAITAVERRAVVDAARRAGAVDTQLIEQPVAAAVGAGLPLDEPLGSMVVDIGGGTTETAVLSLGGVVAVQAIRVGSFDIDSAIHASVKREHGVAVGERTAEDIKVAVGSAWPPAQEVEVDVRGRDLVSGLPRTVVVSSAQVRVAIDEQVGAICQAVVTCLGQAPPDLAKDLIDQGVHLVGGGALLQGLDERLTHVTGVPVHVVDSPRECVVRGAGRCIESYESLKVLFVGARAPSSPEGAQAS